MSPESYIEAMSISAQDTNKALRRHVIPLLKESGFDDATGRKFWRRSNGKTDHIEIQGLSTYRALTDEATTASFHFRLGISLPHYGFENDPFQRDHIKAGPKGPRPKESQMPIRGVLCPKGSPPLSKGRWGWEYQSLWRIKSEIDAEEAAMDLREQLERYALEWLDREWDMMDFQGLLQSKETRLFIAKCDNGSHLQLAGELYGSPIRQAHLTMVKRAIRAAQN